MGQAESKTVNGNDKVFENRAKWGTNRFIYLEDLVNASDVQPQPQLQQAKINLRFYEWACRSRDEFERDYRLARENLERAAPNLRELRIEASYAHKPELDALPEAKEMFETEAKLLQNRIEGLMYAWKNCPILLYRVEFAVYWIVDKKAIDGANFEKIGKKIFGPKVQSESHNGHIQWKYYFEDTSIHLSFHFLKETDHACVEPGRCAWPK